MKPGSPSQEALPGAVAEDKVEWQDYTLNSNHNDILALRNYQSHVTLGQIIQWAVEFSF